MLKIYCLKMDQKKIKKISRYGKFLLQATKVALNCLPMQISCEIYYMGKQLTLAENPLGGFPAGASFVSNDETNADRYRYCRHQSKNRIVRTK